MIDALATLYLPAGVLIGLAAAAPVGPVNLLVIQRTLTTGAAGGVLVGAAGAVGDAVFASAAAFGIGALARFVASHGWLIRIAGGIVLLIFAAIVWRAAPRLTAPAAPASTVSMMAATLAMTLTNPATLLFFVAAFGAVGFVGIGHATVEQRASAALVVGGVFAGSLLWFAGVAAAARGLRGRLTDRHLVWLNHATALVLASFAVVAVGSGVGMR